MEIELRRPRVEDLAATVAALGAWQGAGDPVQLHPGDLGWHARLGPEQSARALRTWLLHGRPVAIGLLDGPGLVRLAIAPQALRDDALAERLADDLTDPARDVLPHGEARAEVPPVALLDDALADRGWCPDERWSLLLRDLAAPVESPWPSESVAGRVEVVGDDRAREWAQVHSAAFGSRATDDAVLGRWQAMARGPAYADARCLLLRDQSDAAVAAAVVWSAGPGRHGLLEPLGVHPDHRGRGLGRAATLAAARALRELGCATALVATPSANVGAVATYVSAGFDIVTERRDRLRPAAPGAAQP